MSLLEVRHLKKVYTTRFGGNQVEALRNVNFTVEAGEYVAIMGESGSGKTTLLNILAALDRPTAGEVLLNGKALSNISREEAGRLPAGQSGLCVPGIQSAGHLLHPRITSSCLWCWLVCAYEEMERRLKAHRRHRWASADISEQVPLRGLRRSKAACRSRPGPHYRASDHSGRRTHRRPGFQGLGLRCCACSAR